MLYTENNFSKTVFVEVNIYQAYIYNVNKPTIYYEIINKN